MLRRGPKKIARGFLISGSQSHGCVRRGGHIFFKPATDVHELRKALHREKKRRVGASRSLQNLWEVPVSKGREFIEYYAEERPVRPVPLFLAFVPLPDNQLQILK